MRLDRPRIAGAFTLIAGLSLLVAEPRFIVQIREALFDGYQRWMPRARDSQPALIVAIDEESLAKVGQWPWPRRTVARLIEAIQAAKPAAVGLDMLFVEPSRNDPEGDLLLAQAIASGPTVLGIVGVDAPDPRFPGALGVAPSRVGAGVEKAIAGFAGYFHSHPPIQAAARGQGLLAGDPGSVVRRVPLAARVADQYVTSLGIEMIRLATSAPAYQLAGEGAGLRLGVGQLAIDLEADGALRLWFGWSESGVHGDRRSAGIVRAVDLLEARVPADHLEAKLVLVGLYGTGLFDVQTSPLGERLPGVEVHAQILEQIFDGTLIHRPPLAPGIEMLLLAACGALLIIVVPLRRSRLPALLLTALIVALAAAGILAFRAGLVIDVLTPALGVLAIHGAVLAATLGETERERLALREAQARLAGELDAARRIQTGLLPSPAAVLAGDGRSSAAAYLEPARTVGGDFYDCFYLGRNRFFVLVADVSGKGLPASLFMALSKALLKSIALRESAAPGEILTRANAEIARDNPESLFVTAFAASLDLESGELWFCNAGHEPALIRHASGEVNRLDHAGGPPLCVIDGFEYASAEHRLSPGDTLLLLSDGVTEAMNRDGALFGAARLHEALARSGDADPEATLGSLRSAVGQFVAGAEPSDDLTLLCLAWRGPSATGR